MRARAAFLIASLLLLILLILIGVQAVNPPYEQYAGQSEPIQLVPTLTGEAEYCLTCHLGIEEISASHPVDIFGCVRCHGGTAASLDPEGAHDGLIGGGNPSDYRVVEQTCGGSDCHAGSSDDERDHINRSLSSVQATYAGAIASVRFTFGAQENMSALFGIEAFRDAEITTNTGVGSIAALESILSQEPTPVQRFAENCLECHLWAEPRHEPGFERLTGCSACHSVSNFRGTYVGDDPTIARDEAGHAAVHQLTTVIPYTQCNACHNRGNYSLVDMNFHPREDLPVDRRASRLDDYYQPIGLFTQCEWELDCIDCHTSGEVMGDGDLHSSQSEIQYVQCKTCHGTNDELPATFTISDSDDLAIRRAFLNRGVELSVGDTVIQTEQGETLWNISLNPDDTFTLIGKATGIDYDLPLVANSTCEQKPDEQESQYCHECHAVERP
jgi:hypothetical protein